MTVIGSAVALLGMPALNSMRLKKMRVLLGTSVVFSRLVGWLSLFVGSTPGGVVFSQVMPH